jgi:RNA polymerase sigma-70 factor (ECF subfamily)
VSPSLTEVNREVAEFEDEIFDRYAPAIYRFAFQHLGNRPDAEDVTSRVFLQVTRLGPPPDESTWRVLLFRAARAEIVEVWHQHGPFAERPLGSLPGESGPAEAAANGDVASRWRQCLDELSPTLRRLVELRFLAGQSLAATAQALGVSKRDAQRLQHEALRQAADIIAARG